MSVNVISNLDTLNIRIKLPSLNNPINYIQQRAISIYKASIDETEITSKELDKNAEKVSSKAVEHFRKNIEHFSTKFKSLDCFQPSEYYLKLHNIVIYKIQKIVNLYLLNSPKSIKFEESWNKFRSTYAQLRYNNSPQLINHLREYHQFLIDEIKQNSPSPEFSESLEKEWKFLEKIVQTDIDLLEVPLATLKGFSDLMNISIEHLFETQQRLFTTCLQTFPWVLALVEEKLRPFASLPQNSGTNFSQALLKKISAFKNNLLPKFIYLNFDKETTYSCQTENYINQLQEDSLTWLSSKVPSPWSIKDEPEKGLTIIRNVNEAPPCFKERESILTPLKKVLKEKEDLKALVDQNISLSEDEEDGLPFINETNISNLKQAIAFFEVIQECHVLLDSYLIGFLNPFTDVCSSIFNSLKKLKKGESFKKIIDTNKKLIASQTRLQNQSVSDVLKFIGEEPSQKTPKRRSRNKRKKKVPQSVQKIEPPKEIKKSPSIASKKTEKKDLGSKKIPFIHLVEPSLAHHVINTNPRIPKHTAKQAHMYWQDMLAAQNALARATDPASKRFYLILSLHSAYFYLEQILQHQQSLINPGLDPRYLDGGHNLVRLLRDSNLNLATGEVDLINELFLANFWVRNPYEQWEKREAEQVQIPTTLRDAKAIYENDPSTGSLQSTINKIKNYVNRITEFSGHIPFLKIQKTSTPITPSPEISFPGVTLENKLIIEIAAKCHEIFPSIPTVLKAKFKQVIQHLEIIKGIHLELQKEISPELFSLLIRSLLFWENTLLEGIVHSLYALNKGDLTNSHKISFLCQEINWKQESDSKYLKFLLSFPDLHNISRYPFSVEDEHEFRDLILQAELFRECPTLGLKENPFQLQGENKTPLNYLKVSRQDFKPAEMGIKLSHTSNMIMETIQKLLLPEIQENLIR